MKLAYRTTLKLENFDKCELICDNDTSLGSLYDFTCSLKAFLIERIHAEQIATDPPTQDIKQE